MNNPLTVDQQAPLFFFLGGVFPEEQLDFIRANSIGVVQNAADVLQKNLLEGLDNILPNGLVVINLPFVGSFPQRFRVLGFPQLFTKIYTKSCLYGLSFTNLSLYKLFSRFASSLLFLVKEIKNKPSFLLVYSAHLPFVLSSLIIKKIKQNTKVFLIIPDLPEHMSEQRSLLKVLDVYIFYRLVKYFDGFVLLTNNMATKLNIPVNKYLVIEGVASSNIVSNQNFDTNISRNKRVFLYAGTLARRYGIIELIDSFSILDAKDVELWICGDGDGLDYVTSATQVDSRIKYFGQVDRSMAVYLQSQATVLVNPRPPGGEFTKYSFPSKIIEYMSTGRPVLMYKLEGIPSEYDGLYICPDGVGVNSLFNSLKKTLSLSDKELNRIGLMARDFVLNNKNPTAQAEKIYNFISEFNKC